MEKKIGLWGTMIEEEEGALEMEEEDFFSSIARRSKRHFGQMPVNYSLG